VVVLGFWRERREALFCVADDIPILGEIRGGEYHECQIGGLAMEVRVSVMLRDLLDVLVFAVAVCKWGQQYMRSSESYLLG
jgi:hypothetical protein